MAFLVILAIVAVLVVLIRATDTRLEKPRSPTRPDILEQVRARGSQRRLRYLRGDIDEGLKWFLMPSSPMPVRDKARKIYNENGARIVLSQLEHGNSADKVYAELAIADDLDYVIKNSHHLKGSLHHQLSGITTLREEMEVDAMSSDLGSPAATANSVVDAYEKGMEPGESHESGWEEAFAFIIMLRAQSYAVAGLPRMPLMLADDLIWLSADQEEIGCLAMMALGIVWFEFSSEQRAVMRQRPALEATARAVYRAVRRRQPKALRSGSEADFIKVATAKLTAQLSDKMDARVRYSDPEDCI